MAGGGKSVLSPLLGWGPPVGDPRPSAGPGRRGAGSGHLFSVSQLDVTLHHHGIRHLQS